MNLETVGIGFYFEDQPLGRRFKTLGRSMTEADIVAFINACGMTEVLFTNLEYLKHESDIEGRLVPGSMVFCFAEGLLMQSALQKTGVAFLGMDFNVKGPSFAGDTIHVEVEVIEARASGSRPNRGLVRTRNLVVNQKGEVVLEYTPLRMVKRRP